VIIITTIKDVAKEAGVSIATVSYVINNTRYVSTELMEKTNKAIKKLSYRPDAIARGLKTKKTHTIGLIISDLSNPFYSSLIKGVENFAMKKNYSLIICNTNETLNKENLYIDVLLKKKIDGLIIAPTGKNIEIFAQLKDEKVPFVFVDRKIKGIEIDVVLSDNIKGAYEATKHLIELGHKKIGVLIGLKSITTSIERFRGYKKALKEYNIDIDPKLLVEGSSRIESAQESIVELLNKPYRPTAIFSTNNLMTIGAMRGIVKKGLKCPDEISLVGFDDFDWASTFKPTLTTVAQQPYKLGEKAAEMLCKRIKNKSGKFKEIRIPTELRIRNSTGPA